MAYTSPFAFERQSNILSFSRNTLPIKNKPIHLFIPWTSEFDQDLMFNIKKSISDNGQSIIPFSDLNMNPALLEKHILADIEIQIKNGIETHLVMSNGETIHILKVSGISHLVNKKNKNLLKI